MNLGCQCPTLIWGAGLQGINLAACSTTQPCMDTNITPLPTLTIDRIRRPWLRRIARLLAWLAVLAYFGFALVFLSLRYVILPHVNEYHVDFERMLSDSLKLPVAIAGIDAQWQGLRPQLAMRGFQVLDKQGRPGLVLDEATAEISWASLLHFGLRLERLEITAPALTIRRDLQGQVFLAGLPINAVTPDNQSDFSDWLLTLHQVIVRNASITWVDEQRAAAPLELQNLNLHVENDGTRHRFGVTADPPRALAARLDLRGDFIGRKLDELAAWKGDAYVELDYADLAIWRTWIDYPLELPRGSGGIRLWLSFAGQQLTEVTADIALANVNLRLARNLPELDLQTLEGRLAGKRLARGLEIGARRLALTTSDGIAIQPTDFQLKRNDAADGLAAGGAFSARDLDLDAFARLAAFLPIADETRKQITEAAPRGKLIEMKSTWDHAIIGSSATALSVTADQSGLASYTLQGRFERLGMKSIGMLPGFDGISGSLDISDKGGSLRLDSQRAALELPKVFADPHLVFDSLKAEAVWKTRNENGRSGVEVKLHGVTFENPDAAGTASGSYLGYMGDPGEIELNAQLTRASGTAVWRYMPLMVHPRVSEWLRTSILSGISNDTTLRLKGDLKRFPFADGSGIFEVKGRFHDGALLYAANWPQIDQINGELEFAAKRMLIKANRGTIYGVDLSGVKAEIVDLASEKEPLNISGKAAGPSAEFLRFIENSPVGEHIDHFTEGMTATGIGQLNLNLSLPLGHLADSKSEGVYQFANNKLMIDPDLPPISDVNGRLQFSGNGLRADRLRATLLGAPLAVDVKTVGNGTVLVNAEGSLSVSELRKQFSHPLLDHLSGSTAWRGSVRVRKRNAEVVLESKLQGLSSSLPEPFNKSASDTLLLRIERRQLPQPQRVATGPVKGSGDMVPPSRPRDQVDVTFGNVLAARLVRRHEGDRSELAVLERGAIAIGETLVLPDKGMLVAVNQQKIDVDFWRRMMFRGSVEKTEGSVAGKLPRIETSVALKAQQLLVFGHTLNDLEVRASTTSPANVREAGWRAEVSSRELVGDLTWRNLGAGRLSGHLKKLSINAATAVKPADDQVGTDALKEMPGLDLEVDQFLLRGKDYGKLKLVADNREGAWEAKLNIENDDGNLSGEGQWRPGANQSATHLKFLLNVRDIEKLLTRLGYSDVLRRGSAKLDGVLSWNGSPFLIDYPSLNGMLDVAASNGQFNKLEPGVGRLLGILSLQSLPRRITLDFRDIFSQGLAFDSISGRLNLTRGIMDTRNFLIQGPSAKILMSGSVNLPQESQNLRVRVSPALTETLAVGAMLTYPAAGAIAWLADKILKNPLDQIFAYDYAITGSWADPKVGKLSGQEPDFGKADKPK